MESSRGDSGKCYQIIVVGAGIAGLSAARHLRKNGIDNFVILEATDKPGGRIQTASFGKGLVELGAQWIHGEQNEFCQLVKTSNHRHDKTSWEGKGDFLCPTGSKVENEMVNEVLGWVEDTIEEVEGTFTIETLQEGKRGAAGHEQTSMGEYLQKRFNSYLKPGLEQMSSLERETKEALFQWAMSFQRIDNSCNGMNDVSLYRWSEFEVNPGEHYNNFRKGADAFIQNILVGSNKDSSLESQIIYESPVENIVWSRSSSEPVQVLTWNGVKYSAKSVIITCSIGVLKSKMESLFAPNLPEPHALAIKSTGYGPVTKIFVEWDTAWWPSYLKGFQLVWPKEYIDSCVGCQDEVNDLERTWHKTITGFDPVLDNPNVLLAWLGGPEAVYAETLSKQIVMERCVQILKDFTGLEVPQAKDAVVSKWNGNEFFQGAYSFRSVDGDKIPGDICAVLCEPISVTDADGKDKPVIVFAGEALSKTHYSTLHGAYESGIGQAQKLVQYWKSVERSAKGHHETQSAQTTQPRKSSFNETFRRFQNVSVNNDIRVPS